MASKTESSSSTLANRISNMSDSEPNLSENSDFKDNFNKKLFEFYDKQCGNLKKPWSKLRVLEVIKQIKSAKVALSYGVRRTSSEYYWMSKYDTMQVSGEDYLILKKSSADDTTIRVIAMEDYFDLLMEIHRECGHGGRDKMKYIIKDKFYIQTKAIELFVSLCPTCDQKRNLPKKSIATKPIVSKDLNVRGQVDLIDFQSTPDNEYKWLLNYQDHATKFVHLRPLRTKQTSEVALEILFIFLEFGAPYILQSDNGREFTAKVLEELAKLWPECKIVHGTPQHPQTQGNVENSNQDVENLLRTWMQENSTTNWSIGCRFVQYQKNSLYHRIIGRSPYRALFGCDPKCGLRSSNIPSDILESIDREEQLDDIMNGKIFNRNNIENCNNIAQNSVSIEKNDASNFENQNISQNSGIHQKMELINTNKENTDQNSVMIQEIKVEISPEVVDNLGSISPASDQGTSGTHFCQSCLKPVHTLCESSYGNEGYNSKILCLLCTAEQNIKKECVEAHQGVKRAAEESIDETAEKLPRLNIGHSVILNVPKMDRGPLDTKNILGKILDSRNGVYQIGTEAGIIKDWYPHSDIEISLIEYKGQIPETLISLREAVIKESIFGGQGFQRCTCKPAKNQCQTNRCACFKKKVLCGSKCHSNLMCINT